MFLGDGAYNITVTAYSNQDEGHQKIPILVSYLDNLFYVESFPNASLPQRNYFAEVGNLTNFKLKKKNPYQTFKVDWTMGDGATYIDAGLLLY